jgi:hypothetical protein
VGLVGEHKLGRKYSETDEPGTAEGLKGEQFGELFSNGCFGDECSGERWQVLLAARDF